MNDNRGAYSGFYKKVKSPYKKYFILTFFAIILFFLFSGVFDIFEFLENSSVKETDGFCGDGTMYNSCSSTKPYFCDEGKLIELASTCGCPEDWGTNKNICFSKYNTGYKKIQLNYTLRGEKSYIDFVVYEGFKNYSSNIPRAIYTSPNTSYSIINFTLRAIDEEEQAKFLMPLVIKIQNITNDRDDQMRIAISLVQNIPFGASNKTILFGSTKVNYSRYPYEVLYDLKGVCGEKTELLAFLLRGLGYGTSFFYYPPENHEALGLKCPLEESLMESGYCFVETTAPSIITDSEISYVGVGKLSSKPQIYLINNGKSIEKGLEEYRDADRLIKIRDFVEDSGLIGPIRKMMLDNLKKKYGLSEKYYS
ncbi:MAG: hypothetical protein ACP5NZ_03430 [Nanobdellota archaeon]